MSRRILLAQSGSAVVVPQPGGDTGGNADHATLQNAIDSLASTGGIVVLDGDWWVKGTLEMRDGVHLAGSGWRSSVIHRAAGSTGHLITTPDVMASWGLSDLLIDGHYEDNPDALDNIHITGGTGNYPPGWGGKYGVLDTVASKWARRDNFFSSGVETKMHQCFGYGARRNNFRAQGSDQFYSMCTSGNSDFDGVAFENCSGFRLVGFKAWCAGWKSARGANGIYAYENPATNFRLAGENFQTTGCESQDAAAAGAAIASSGGIIEMFIDAPGAYGPENPSNFAAVDIGYCDSADIRIRIGTGTSHVSPINKWAAHIGGQVRNCRIDIMGSTQHMESMSLTPSSEIHASNHITLGTSGEVIGPAL